MGSPRSHFLANLFMGHHKWTKSVSAANFRKFGSISWGTIRFDEGLKLETSASESLYGGQFASAVLTLNR